MLIWILVLAVAGLSMLLYMRYLAGRDHVREEVVQTAFGNDEDRLRIFFISDIHNRLIKEQTLKNAGKVDAVIIGGDLVDKRTSISKLETNLRRLNHWEVPVYFIPGNNDHELIEEPLTAVLDRHRVVTLSNEDVEGEGKGGTPFIVTGLDPYFLKPRRSVELADSSCFRILCVHDPYVYSQMNAQEKKKYDLILSGHTHGGQIRLFGMGPYQRGGWSRRDSIPHLVSEGYGTSLLPLRLGTRAECHVIDIGGYVKNSSKNLA
ncbi:metallophosphoesterase [Halobacillus kuroshimensis]|uniref:Metallophosphoesterase n=1 Tax=Halobacillus kuroshimensis TaxID=302481 RepID=A0ABS3DTM5_9BACI|nr:MULTISPECIES: metallophosphoesterase [Halobacillus]MBN8234709.1 metallophosphoesterase [Halobacillus kuroshimensis]